jgi:DNA repair protein RecO (recombination protein O)
MTESSRLVTFFSKEFGKLKGVAKGVGRPKSRLGGKVELFNLIEGDFYKKEVSELGILSNAGLLDDFKGIAENARKYGFASAWCEVLDRITQPEEPRPKIFELTAEYFKTLQTADSKSAGLLFWSALLKLLVFEGYSPGFDVCISCGKVTSGERTMISLQRGGLICPKCVEPDEAIVYVTPEALALLRTMMTSPLAEMAGLEVNERTGKLAAEIILSFASYHLGLPRNLKSFKFLEELTDFGKPRI